MANLHYDDAEKAKHYLTRHKEHLERELSGLGKLSDSERELVKPAIKESISHIDDLVNKLEKIADDDDDDDDDDE